MIVKTFFIEPSERVTRRLRRYASDWDYSVTPAVNRLPCEVAEHHDVVSPVIDELIVPVPVGYETDERITSGDCFQHADPRWPTHCTCGFEFREEDNWQLSVDRLYRRADTSEEMRLHEWPAGAMWFADWMLIEGSNHYRGPDGHSLVVRLPDGHDWNVDGGCNNCDSPCRVCGVAYHSHPAWRGPAGDTHMYEDARPHKCWVRHGEARTGQVTVDKNGVTCGAGAGSIATPGWHGFLTQGELRPC
jgi:hypothetical protein